MKKKSLEKIQEVFITGFGHLHLQIPEDNLVNRTKGSMAFGSGKLFYIFGEEEGREYLEYYSHPTIRSKEIQSSKFSDRKIFVP
jgi:hypothetical protein